MYFSETHLIGAAFPVTVRASLPGTHIVAGTGVAMHRNFIRHSVFHILQVSRNIWNCFSPPAWQNREIGCRNELPLCHSHHAPGAPNWYSSFGEFWSRNGCGTLGVSARAHRRTPSSARLIVDQDAD